MSLTSFEHAPNIQTCIKIYLSCIRYGYLGDVSTSWDCYIYRLTLENYVFKYRVVQSWAQSGRGMMCTEC
jgi:hypothetical protein